MCRVLVVEDEPDLREMMGALLHAYGYHVHTASNGVQALSLLHAHPPCLVLLDLMMAVMDGFEFRRRQLADAGIAPVPVVCLTALFNATDVTRTSGVRCLAKPVGIEALIEVVEAHCPRPIAT